MYAPPEFPLASRFFLTKPSQVVYNGWLTVLSDERALRMPSWQESDLRPPGRLVNSPKDKKSQTRHFAQKKFSFFTFEAGMCMKTKGRQMKCPKRIGHLCLTFGHLRRTDTDFAEFRGFFGSKWTLVSANGARYPSENWRLVWLAVLPTLAKPLILATPALSACSCLGQPRFGAGRGDKASLRTANRTANRHGLPTNSYGCSVFRLLTQINDRSYKRSCNQGGFSSSRRWPAKALALGSGVMIEFVSLQKELGNDLDSYGSSGGS